METTVEFVEKSAEAEDLIKLFRAVRFAYRIGKPLMEDAQYDDLVLEIAKTYPNTEELFQVYEEDKIIPEELLEFGIDAFDIAYYSQQRSIDREFTYTKSKELIEEDNKSIVSYKTEEETFNAFQQLGEGTYILSPKIDGVFASAIYERLGGNVYQLKCGKSRGDITKSVDITSSLTNILPQVITLVSEEDSVKFNFEGTYEFSEVAASGYINQRSACQGVFSSTVNKKTNLHKNVLMFCHGSSLNMRYSQAMEVVKKIGFIPVPTYAFEFKSDMSFEEYVELITPLKETIKYWHAINRIEADGIVAVKEDFEEEINGVKGNKQYNRNVFALKSDYWNNGYYEAKIVGFTAGQQNSDISYTILFEPTVMPDGKVQDKITDIRLRTIKDAKMKVGDTVGFYYLNSTTVKFKQKVIKEEYV